MIRTRMGEAVELVRVATIDDVKTFECRRPDKQDRERTKDGWRAIARYVVGGSTRSDILVDAAYLKATNGWAEISEAFDALRTGVSS
jgi:hypothetical protein